MYSSLVLETLIFGYFIYVSLYNLSLAIAGLFPSRRFSKHSPEERVLVLIPAYKEDAVIFETAQHALKQNYPSGKYHVTVIADSLQESTLSKLRSLPITVEVVSFEKSTKVKALNRALANNQFDADLLVILDADNQMHPEFLNEVNKTYQAGHKAIQGLRSPKNRNSKLAVLDGLSEAINNHIFRKGTCNLGWSASLNGSGMAFDYQLAKDHLSKMQSVGGFDRELEVHLLLSGHKVQFNKYAEVFDEKTSNEAVFANQRRRWIYSQYHYLFKFLGVGLKALITLRLALFNSTILRNVQLPRSINILLFFFYLLLYIVFQNKLSISLPLIFGIVSAFYLSFFISIPRSFYNRDLFRALIKIPHSLLLMLKALFTLNGANKKFIHTPHGQDEK